MNEQPNQQPYNQPAQTPPPVSPPEFGQPVPPSASAPDPSLYQAPIVPITSRPHKIPVWLYAIIGVCFLSAVGLLVAVIILM